MDNVRIPFIHSYRAAFFVFFVAGVMLCSMGGISQAPVKGWLHPISILGYALGAATLLLGISVLFRIRIAPITDDRVAFFALLGIVAIKIIAVRLYPLF